MKAILTGVVAALAFTATTAAFAQDPSVQIKPTQRYHMMAEDFRDFKNTYLMQNGEEVSFSNRGNRYYTQVGEGERVEIVPVTRNVFRTPSGARIEFREEGQTVGIANYEKLSVAANLPANTMMMASARR